MHSLTFRCKKRYILMFAAYCAIIYFVINPMYTKNAVDLEIRIRDPNHIIIEEVSKSNVNSSAKEPVYNVDIKKMMVTQPVKEIDLAQVVKPKVHAESLKHRIPSFDDVAVFWDDGVASAPTKAALHPQSKEYHFEVNDSHDDDDNSPVSAQNKNRIVVENNVGVTAGSKFVVISCVPVTLDSDLNYAFNLPMIVYFWQRLGFRTIALLVGSEASWTERETTALVLRELRATDAVIVFLDVMAKHSIMVGQVSRLFVPLILEWLHHSDVYLVLSDADLFPLMAGIYDLPPGKKILALNSECCGDFVHDGAHYKMLPMCNIGMNVSTWCEVMRFRPGDRLLMPEQIVEYVAMEMGDVARTAVSKGDNEGWFIDQHLVSIRLAQWASVHSNEDIAYMRRDTQRDRIDRSYWNPYVTSGIKDSHLLEKNYLPVTWERMRPLVHTYFDIKSPRGQWFENYREEFLKIYLNNTSSGSDNQH